MSNVKTVVNGDAVTGSYPIGGTGNLPSARVPRRSGLEPVSGDADIRSMAQRAATGSYGRLLDTAAGMGRIQAGTRGLLGSVSLGSFFTTHCQPMNQSLVSGMMRGLMGRLTTDPFDEAMIGFNKKAKKFSKKI